MAPFRWPEARHELALAKEVAQHNPEKPDEWEAVARRLGKAFSTDSCTVELKGRGCREKMDRILTKYKEEDMKGFCWLACLYSQLSKTFNPLLSLVTITNVQQVHMFVSRIAFLFNNLALLMVKCTICHENKFSSKT